MIDRQILRTVIGQKPVTNAILWLKVVENGRVPTITLLSNLKQLFPKNWFLSKKTLAVTFLLFLLNMFMSLIKGVFCL